MHQYKRQLRPVDSLFSVFRAVAYRLPLTLLNWVVQRFFRAEKHRWIFMNQNRELTGNLLYLFEHVRQHEPSVSAKLMLFDKSLAEKLVRRYGQETAMYAWSWDALQAFFGSGVVVIAYGMVANAFFPYVLSRRTKLVVNLWHGVPLKRVGYQARHSFERQRHWERQHYSKMVASSKFEQLAFAACFQMNIDDIWISGVPRNDPLCQPARPLAAELPAGAKVILYAPTWRDGAEDAKLFPFEGVDLAYLNAWLGERSAVLLVRFHYIERAATFESLGNIIHDDGARFGEVQQILANTAVLITDYSSIYFDYLLLDRPIVFIPYDAVEYEMRRGFMLPYDWATPGPKVKTWDEFLVALDRALDNPDHDEPRRKEVRDFTHAHADGKASQRICSEIRGELEGR
ncbi:MAG: CDP-glycerol glycerophosphotransferase family protein [Pseudomonadota bacterium]